MFSHNKMDLEEYVQKVILRSVHTTPQLHILRCRTAHPCDVTALRYRMKVKLILT